VLDLSPAGITLVDKSVLSHPEPRRVRDREHVRFVAQQTSKPVWSASASRAMSIIFALRKIGRLPAKSAMSSRSRSAGDIIVNSIATAMKPDGGRNSGSIRPPRHERCGSRHIQSV
jgi:hypothetical protein